MLGPLESGSSILLLSLFPLASPFSSPMAQSRSRPIAAPLFSQRRPAPSPRRSPRLPRSRTGNDHAYLTGPDLRKAHVITATGLLIQDGVTGGGKDAAHVRRLHRRISSSLIAYNLKPGTSSRSTPSPSRDALMDKIVLTGVLARRKKDGRASPSRIDREETERPSLARTARSSNTSSTRAQITPSIFTAVSGSPKAKAAATPPPVSSSTEANSAR
jgi:hypothetical protein